MLKYLMICGTAVLFALAASLQPSAQISVLRGHTYEVFTLAYSPDGKTLASGSGDFHQDPETDELHEYGELKFWDLESRTQLVSIDGDARCWVVGFSPDGKLAVAGCGVHGQRAGQIQVWDWRAKKMIAAATQEWLVQSLAISPDGTRLATVSHGSQALLWELPALTNPTVLDGHVDNVKAVAFSPDGKLVATGSWDKSVKLWDASTAQCVRTLPLDGPAGYVSTVAFSPDGKIVAAGSGTIESGQPDAQGMVTLWNAQTGAQISTLPHRGYLTALKFSPDGGLIATGSRDKTVRLWEVSTLRQLHELEHAGPIEAVAFSPDGATLATVGRDRECAIRLWDVSELCGEALAGKPSTGTRAR